MNKDDKKDPEMCIVCLKEFKDWEDKEFVCIGEDRSEYIEPIYTHTGDCTKQYKEAMESDASKEKGYILGMCGWCYKPVRSKEKYSIWRRIPRGQSQLWIYTNYPKWEELIFAHEGCAQED